MDTMGSQGNDAARPPSTTKRSAESPARHSKRSQKENQAAPKILSRSLQREIMAMLSLTSVKLNGADDFHHHFRDGDVLKDTVPHAARRFRRAIAMPNLKPPVVNTAQAIAYRERILAHVPEGLEFEPLMTLYMTDNTTAEDIREAKESGIVAAVKLYPAGATTNSDSGVTDIRNMYPVMEVMADLGIPLLVHGEVTRADIDVFDREECFVDETLKPLIKAVPRLKVVMEHITTRAAAVFVASASPLVAATITPQHLLYNRNDIFRGGLRPHLYCLPLLKRENDRQALLAAATSGSPKFFLGTDSAPHPEGAKLSACGCAGIFTGHAALELYAEAFDSAGFIVRLNDFASRHGSAFYGLPRNTSYIQLEKESWTVPESYPLGGDKVVPLRAGKEITWRIVDP